MNEYEFTEQVASWVRELREAGAPYPFHFGMVSRRWSKAAAKYGKPLKALLESNARFGFMVRPSTGGFLMICRTDAELEASRALMRSFAEEDARAKAVSDEGGTTVLELDGPEGPDVG